MGIARRLQSLLSSSRTNPGPPAASDGAWETIPQAPEGPKLNLGCGFDIREGWVNIDLHGWHKPDIVSDITNLTALADNYAGYALAQDILEHVHRDRCSTALREWNRVLRTGGLLEVRVPDVIALAQLMQAPERQSPDEQATLLKCMFGTQSYAGDFHYNGFTKVSLTHDLSEAGFELAYLAHVDDWMFRAIARKVTHTQPHPLLKITSDEEFVERAYETFLGRKTDPEGKAYYVDKISSGVPREVVMAALKEAKE